MAEEINGVKVLCASNIDMPLPELGEHVQDAKQQLGSGIVLFMNRVMENKITLMCAVSDDLTDTYSAGKLVNIAAVAMGGSGEGDAGFGQGVVEAGNPHIAFNVLKAAL